MNRIGFGYDSHRFAPDCPLVLGGVEVPHDQGLAGHSDADALLHALTDALLGAIGAGDIGRLFPPSDPQWANADSAIFVRRAMQLLAGRKARVVNCDLTILAETPRISPHAPQMAQTIAALLGVEPDRVNVKGKTNEQMGWIGRGEGIAAQAAVLIEIPS
jgi:2-C-methyl-D-erythritol 2,4-cyclodiphosphate synthase